MMQNRPLRIDSPYEVPLHVMRHMGWSWPDLLATPADLVDEIWMRLVAEQKWRGERAKQERAEKELERLRHGH